MKQFTVNYVHCDVFTNQPLLGNSLTVFFVDKHPEYYSSELLLSITREMRHFESIFVSVSNEDLLKSKTKDIPSITIPARIFACSSELDFAGHPLLGAACSIHEQFFTSCAKIQVNFSLNERRTVIVQSDKFAHNYQATMAQGQAHFYGIINDSKRQKQLLAALNLTLEDYDARYPMEIVSTGLKYLIIPVKNQKALAKAKVVDTTLGDMLTENNSEFVYVVDVQTRTARTWENDGSSEDAATGSAAGPFAAYMVKHGIAKFAENLEINQGDLIGRSSKLLVQVCDNFEDILVTGGVCMIAHGQMKLSSEIK